VIACTEFIPAYNELFKFLDTTKGKDAVVAFWESLSDAFLGNLHDLVAEKGLAGCYEYWSRTLTEEAADFRMKLDETNNIFRIEMRGCPSKARLLEDGHIHPYENYCEHCDVLYRRVLEPLGYVYDIDLSHSDEARCVLTVKKKDANKSEDQQCM
jgi:hypothetical protein